MRCSPLTSFSIYFIVQSKSPADPELVGGSQSPWAAQSAGFSELYAKARRENQVSDP